MMKKVESCGFCSASLFCEFVKESVAFISLFCKLIKNWLVDFLAILLLYWKMEEDWPEIEEGGLEMEEDWPEIEEGGLEMEEDGPAKSDGKTTLHHRHYNVDVQA